MPNLDFEFWMPWKFFFEWYLIAFGRESLVARLGGQLLGHGTRGPVHVNNLPHTIETINKIAIFQISNGNYWGGGWHLVDRNETGSSKISRKTSNFWEGVQWAWRFEWGTGSKQLTCQECQNRVHNKWQNSTCENRRVSIFFCFARDHGSRLSPAY